MNPPDVMLGPDKALAVGSYGETVAAYRYLVFAEKAATPAHRHAFAAMADEEQGHKQRLQRLLGELYPNADFVLSESDKELVVVGPRLPDIRDARSFAEALRMTLDSEKRTALFYERLSRHIPHEQLRALFAKLATEGGEHYDRLQALVRDAGFQLESE